MGFIVICIILSIAIAIILMVIDTMKTKRIESILLSGQFIDAETFLKVRKEKTYTSKQSYHSTIIKYAGIYILENTDKNKHYVGQSKDVFSRVFAHLSGRGNGDVYADFKYGDNFKVIILPLNNSEFNNLNDMERAFIDYFNASQSGYNKTRGNK